MGVEWLRNDKQAVLDELRRGVRPLIATSMASGPLDELVALHIELGVFEALDGLAVRRVNGGGIVRRWAVADGRRKWATPLV